MMKAALVMIKALKKEPFDDEDWKNCADVACAMFTWMYENTTINSDSSNNKSTHKDSAKRND